MNTILRVLALLLVLLAPPASGRDAGTDAVDAAAVAAYRAGDLVSARSGWLAALENPRVRGAERARILYDLGNVAFREDKKLEAVGWYSAALRLRPRDADTWANLEHARREAGLEPADRGDLTATLRRLLTAFDPTEARTLALAGLALLAAALGYEALRGGRLARWLALAAFGGALVLSAPCARHWLAGDADPLLVVEEGQAPVRSEPRGDAAVIAEAPAGSQVERLDTLPGWVKVRAADGAEGWVGDKAVFALRR